MRITVLLVAEDAQTVRSIRKALGACRDPRFEVRDTDPTAAGPAGPTGDAVDVVLLDLARQEASGMAALERFRAVSDPPPVVVITDEAHHDAGEEALRRGALDHLDTGGIDGPRLGRLLRLAVEHHRMAQALRRAEHQLEQDRQATQRLLQEQQRSQDALQRSETHLRTLVDTLPDLVWLKDPCGVYLSCNPRFESFFGASVPDIVGKTDYDFMEPALADFFRAHDAAAVAAGAPQTNEEEVTFASDGHRELLETIKTPMFDTEGRLVGVLGIARDITRRKQAEEALRRSEEQVRLKLDSILSPDEEVGAEELANLIDIPALQALMDNFSLLSHAVVAILDTRGKVLLRSGWQDICTVFHRAHPDTARNCTESDLALAENVRPGERVACHCRNGLWDVVTPLMLGGKHVANIYTGQFFYHDDVVDEEAFAARADRAGFDRAAYVSALRRVPRVSHEWVRNLMEFLTRFAELVSRSSFSNLKLAKALARQQRIEEDLRASEERFRHIVETTYDWVWEVDLEGRYTFVSSRVTDLLGYLPEEMLGRSSFDFLTEAEGRRLRAMYAELLSRPVAFSGVENVNRHKDGREVVLESSAAPIFGPDGGLLGYRGMDRDVSERRRMEAQLREVQKLDAIGQLAGGVAHDFNNILAAIMMHLGLLQMNRALDRRTKESLKELEAEAQRAVSLTRQLLMFSRRSVLAVRPQDLNALTANLLKMLTRLIREDITLTFEAVSPLPAIEADAGMVEQVLVNLVVNARDAMPRGGRITIRTSQADFASSRVVDHPERRPGRFVCLTVADTGSGMDARTLARIFEPFFTTKEAGKGTGLGLATVHGIVAQHKGWVEVGSVPGAGTTFHVYFPTLADQAVVATEKAPDAPLPRGSEAVLLVEDETAVRRSIAQALRQLGYQVHEASNGRDAMRVWRTHGPEIDVLLTDMVMPEGMTGLELAEQLQKLKPPLTVIISSGYSAEIVQAGVPNRPGIVYLPKPYDTRTLADTMRRCLGKRLPEAGFSSS